MENQQPNNKVKRYCATLQVSLPLVGGILYTVGSIAYWPSFTSINPATGGILFIVGSILLSITDFLSFYLQPQFNPFNPIKNVGAFRASCIMIGNFSFLIGSIFFLPGQQLVIGNDIFIIGSIFFFIPQFFSIWGVTSLNFFTAPFYVKMRPYKNTVIVANILLAIGCMGFVIGCVLFINQSDEVASLYRQGVILFIGGSACFIIGPALFAKARRKNIFDPLSQHHRKISDFFLTPTQRNSRLLDISKQQRISKNYSIKKQQQNNNTRFQIQMSK